MRSTLVTVVAVAVAAVVAGVLFLRAETMSTHTESPPGSRTEVVVEAATWNNPRSATQAELTHAVVLTCRLEVDAELRTSALRPVGQRAYAFMLEPALDESDEKQLHGCLEDAMVDHVQLRVRHLANLPAPVGG